MIVYRKVTGSIPVEGKNSFFLFSFIFFLFCLFTFPPFRSFRLFRSPTFLLQFLFFSSFFFFFLLWFPLVWSFCFLPSFRVLNTVFCFLSFLLALLFHSLFLLFSNLLTMYTTTYHTLIPLDFHPSLFLRFILRSHLQTDLVMSRSTVSVRSPGPGPWDHSYGNFRCVCAKCTVLCTYLPRTKKNMTVS
ncbi:hypothetical protein QR685DRAFT_122874 [Neurospora intermedia]|uniref:T. brucei spp.-specific protein n=1 Tax=Neurospora intermedia TaxID=5142 RepID=A0ABR3CZ22_NEUIN